MPITRNFSMSEILFSETAARMGIPNIPEPEHVVNIHRLAKWLQVFRNRLSAKYGRDTPITVTSGYRSKKVNKAARGSKTSQHMLGLAADIRVGGFSVAQVQANIIELMTDCLYDQCIDEFSSWVHIGLAPDGDFPRLQNLIARKRLNAFGFVKTQYTLY